ncbi:MAG TPA: hypothetical protein VFS22_09445 [Flavisolibacter sp.]|nr:hypothetical protein [Flavisolibacter sp.]
MNQSQLLFSVLTALTASLFFVAIFCFLFVRGTKRRLKKQFEEEIQAIQRQAGAELEKQLFLFKEDLQRQNAADISVLKDEVKAWTTYEVELLKSKLKNVQPSYPKKLEATQKLAVLLNSINSSPAPLFSEWKTQLQQYLIAYTGMVNADCEGFIASAIEHCNAQDLQMLLSALIKAKASVKEAVLVSSKAV